jgi:DNA-binding protein HU-beta
MGSPPAPIVTPESDYESAEKISGLNLVDPRVILRRAFTLLGDMIGLITKYLKKGEQIRISGLGILQVRKRAARMGRNPATGEPIKIKAGKKVAFRAAKKLKLAIRLPHNTVTVCRVSALLGGASSYWFVTPLGARDGRIGDTSIACCG